MTCYCCVRLFSNMSLHQTYTMMGGHDSKGIIERTISEIFQKINIQATDSGGVNMEQELSSVARVSYVEVRSIVLEPNIFLVCCCGANSFTMHHPPPAPRYTMRPSTICSRCRLTLDASFICKSKRMGMSSSTTCGK
jgi:hypothetical protein